MSFANDILDAIEIMVKQVVEDNATKIYTGVCKTTGVNNCVLTINGKDNTVKYYGGVPVVGTVYQVFIPFGNMSAAFIIVPGSGGGSGGSGVDSVNGKTGDVVLSASDVGAVSKTGDIMTGNLTISKSDYPDLNIENTGSNSSTKIRNSAHRTQIMSMEDSDNYRMLTLHDESVTTDPGDILQITQVEDGSQTARYKVYHTGYNPTPADVGLGNVDNIKQYSEINPPPYPVTSVNKKTGAVVLDASDVNAVAKTGDSMTGTLTVGSASLETNGYVTGTWFKTTANTALSTKPSKIAVIDNGWIYSRTPEQIKNDIGLSNVDNVKQYSKSNPPPYPVTSVNGKTGAVTIESGGVAIVTQSTQPSGQKTGDFWYQVT